MPSERGASHVALVIGTQKGLFVARSSLARARWRLEEPHLAGYEILHAWLDPRNSQTGYAAAAHPVWGAHLYRTGDAGRRWTPLPAVPHHALGEMDPPLKAVWYLAPGGPGSPRTLYAGIDPPGLFVSRDGGATWSPVAGLNHHPTRAYWEPAHGMFAVHSIHVDPRNERRMYAAVSAGGVYGSEDGGETWRAANQGVPVAHVPDPSRQCGHNVHRLVLHPAQPERLYRQCYAGTFRSDDGAGHWIDVTAGLPSDFGYALAVDPRDPDTVFQIPEESSHMRTVVGGRLRVYRSRDAGRTWTPLTRGLPQRRAYVSVLREAMDADGIEPCGLYFGTTNGQLFASRDGGEHWRVLARFLPRILSVRAAVVARDPDR
ncbi:WD40/YVTN/BNR-like repeat-containing protein [Pelomicrobium sp. G1]|uniref:WD40/YVTN/BNR-like repeat-containing protein n=1 Tax=unclassified Pelomicrobium TaxID=2815318 RepID=UPI003F757272